MKLLRRIFDFYLDASIHVGVSVCSLILVTAIFFDIPYDPHLTLFVFFATIASYNFIKYGVEAEKYILVSSGYHRYIQFFSFIAIGFAAYHANFLPSHVWIWLGILSVFIGLYALPVLPRARNLRNLGILKILLIAFVWGGTTVVLPVAATTDHLGWDVHIEAAQRFFLVLILMVPFEIRDLAYDKPTLRTIPQRYGVTNTKIFGAFATIAFFFFTFLKDNVNSLELIGKGILFLALGILMFITPRNQSRYFASFWVEAIPIFWWGAVWGLDRYA